MKRCSWIVASCVVSVSLWLVPVFSAAAQETDEAWIAQACGHAHSLLRGDGRPNSEGISPPLCYVLRIRAAEGDLTQQVVDALGALDRSGHLRYGIHEIGPEYDGVSASVLAGKALADWFGLDDVRDFPSRAVGNFTTYVCLLNPHLCVDGDLRRVGRAPKGLLHVQTEFRDCQPFLSASSEQLRASPSERRLEDWQMCLPVVGFSPTRELQQVDDPVTEGVTPSCDQVVPLTRLPMDDALYTQVCAFLIQTGIRVNRGYAIAAPVPQSEYGNIAENYQQFDARVSVELLPSWQAKYADLAEAKLFTHLYTPEGLDTRIQGASQSDVFPNLEEIDEALRPHARVEHEAADALVNTLGFEDYNQYILFLQDAFGGTSFESLQAPLVLRYEDEARYDIDHCEFVEDPKFEEDRCVTAGNGYPHANKIAGMIVARPNSFGVVGLLPFIHRLAKVTSSAWSVADLPMFEDMVYDHLDSKFYPLSRYALAVNNFSYNTRDANIGKASVTATGQLLNILLVAAAGNSGKRYSDAGHYADVDCDIFPACQSMTQSNVISVIGVEPAGTGDWGQLGPPYVREPQEVARLIWQNREDQETFRYETNYGDAFDVAAPGRFEYSLPDGTGRDPGGEIAGTSYATAPVSTLALLLSAFAEQRPEELRALSPALARARIIGTSDIFVGLNKPAKFGVINYRRALTSPDLDGVVTCDDVQRVISDSIGRKSGQDFDDGMGRPEWIEFDGRQGGDFVFSLLDVVRLHRHSCDDQGSMVSFEIIVWVPRDQTARTQSASLHEYRLLRGTVKLSRTVKLDEGDGGRFSLGGLKEYWSCGLEQVEAISRGVPRCAPRF